MDLSNKIKNAADFIMEISKYKPEIGLILGSTSSLPNINS